jgi:hypothetical protein
MLNKISWSSFVIILALILIMYYLYVLIVYYRKDIFSFSSINKKPITSNDLRKAPLKDKNKDMSKSDGVFDKLNDDSFTLVHELLEDLKTVFIKAAKTKMVKEELIQAISSRLKAYPSLGETDLIEDINTHLDLESKEKCNMELLPEDLKQIWNI